MLVRARGLLSCDECRLRPYEVDLLTKVGQAWHEDAVRNNRNPGLGPSRKAQANRDPSNSIRGAKAQFSASVCLNLYWRPDVGVLDERDVGGLIEVRTTVLTSGRLIIKPEDIDKNYDAPFVLVHCLPGELYRLLGWAFAWQAEAYPLDKRHGDPAHFLEQSELASIDELRDWIRREAR